MTRRTENILVYTIAALVLLATAIDTIHRIFFT